MSAFPALLVGSGCSSSGSSGPCSGPLCATSDGGGLPAGDGGTGGGGGDGGLLPLGDAGPLDASTTDAGVSPGADGGPTATTLCTPFCAKIVASKCPADEDCAANCAAEVANTSAACIPKLNALSACIEGATLVCSSAGKATVSGGVCAAEASAWDACLSDAGTPQADAGGLGPCGTCWQAACSSEVAACNADSACVSLYDCTNECADSPCVNDCYSTYETGVGEYQPLFDCYSTATSGSCAGVCPTP